jgi:hypothetical protein
MPVVSYPCWSKSSYEITCYRSGAGNEQSGKVQRSEGMALMHTRLASAFMLLAVVAAVLTPAHPLVKTEISPTAAASVPCDGNGPTANE